jgi:plasmid stability protein
MATLTIRGVDDEVRERLRVRAAEHGRSTEAEVRAILLAALTPAAPARGLGSRIHARFAGIDGDDLPLPTRTDLPRTVDFDT